MKVSISKFYTEVTGLNAPSKDRSIESLKQWDVPLPENPWSHANCVDVAYLDIAKAKYKQELEAKHRDRVTKKRPVKPPEPKHDGQEDQQHDLFANNDRRVRVHSTDMHYIKQAIGRMEATLNHLVKLWEK